MKTGRLTRELALARVEVRQGRFARSMALIAAGAAIVSGWEAYAQHLRGAFSHWLMWTPVWLTPASVIAALGALVSQRLAKHVLPLVAVMSFVDGIAGFVFHLRGIGRLPGGWQLGRYNIVMGPPVFAPLLTCMVGVIALLAALLRREEIRPLTWQASLATAVLEMNPPRLRRVGPLGAVAASVAHGRFQRAMAVISAVFAILAGAEAYVEHLRGSFNRQLMWTPVWVTPPMVVAALGAAVSEHVSERVLPITSIVTFLDGLLGFGLHLQGLQRMPGGIRNLQFNFTMGPPLFAPLLFSSVGLLGLIASLLRRAQRGSFE